MLLCTLFLKPLHVGWVVFIVHYKVHIVKGKGQALRFLEGVLATWVALALLFFLHICQHMLQVQRNEPVIELN